MHCRPMLALLGFVILALAAVASQGPSPDPASPDEQVVKAAKVPNETEGLLKFFRDRTLNDEDRKPLEALVVQLDSESYEERTIDAFLLPALAERRLPFQISRWIPFQGIEGPCRRRPSRRRPRSFPELPAVGRGWHGV